MNRKIIAIFALLIVATSISAVSAFDLGDIFGGEENQTATIGGVDFNIPAGYENDTQAVSNHFTKAFENEGYKVDAAGYSKGSTGVVIAVVDYSDFEISDEDIQQDFASEGNTTTINNITGASNIDDGAYVFSYAKNYKYVLISADNEQTVSEFLIA